ncbi:MAG: hypothetical protein ACM3ZO_02015 [Clostridia bacterium]
MIGNGRGDIERHGGNEAAREAKGRLVKERIVKDDGRYLIYYSFKSSNGESGSGSGPAAAGSAVAGPANGRGTESV